MKRAFILAAAISMTSLAAQPCLAADDLRAAQASASRSAGFAGLQLGVELGGERAMPRATLGLGMTHLNADNGSTLRRSKLTGLQVGFSHEPTAEWAVAGQSLEELKHRLGVAPALPLVIGGIALAAAAGVAVASSGGDRQVKGICPPGVEVCAQ
jgi:hypothetical protein